MLEGLPAGELDQEMGEGTRADFFLPAASGVSTVRSRIYALVYVGNRNTSGQPSPQSI